ANSRLPTSKI
nr:Chain C, LyCALTPP peptide core [synthetic construct]7JZO_D Chain D, LyCALTPP peptide core [synthetic construct]7JZP_C Chain C, LyCALBF peptide core [synthetic construct]7JZP_D Chain D, LyCALBF peptide core [synthetic construct]7JZQ_C Chain C, LyCALPMB peptide core [synthetic construct]7JZR_C Chain C, LyCALAEB peptide core [synthetic construct]7JZR_D Chain D, LyCALAEB peptide core [synthetic construct]